MAHSQDCARVVRKRFLQDFPAVHIQVVGRFVQQQHVVLPEHQLRQGHPSFFPAAERADRGEHVVSREKEHSQRAAHLILFHPREPVPHLVQHRLLPVQARLVLVIVADIHAGSPPDVSAVRLLLPGQAAQQRGLSRAVVSDQGNPLTRPDMHLHIPEQDPFPVTFFQSFRLQHVLARAPPRVEPELYGILLLRFFQPFDLFQAFLPASRQPDTLFPVEPAVHGDDRLLPGDFLLLQLPGLHPGFIDFRPFFGILRVISRIGFHRAQDQLRHPSAHVVQEIPVVADHQHGPAVAVQVFLQPGDAFQVQVVGRFVQQQQVRLRKQHPPEAEPGPFPAAQATGFHIPHFPELQALQHARHPGTPAVSVLPLKFPGQRVVPPAQPPEHFRVRAVLRHLVFQGAHLRLHADQRPEYAFQRFLYGLRAGQLPLLGQIAGAQSLLHIHAARIGGFLPGDDLHQGALSAPVHAHQAHPVLLLQGKGNALQHLMGAEAFPDLLQRKDYHLNLPSLSA